MPYIIEKWLVDGNNFEAVYALFKDNYVGGCIIVVGDPIYSEEGREKRAQNIKKGLKDLNETILLEMYENGTLPLSGD